MFAGEGDRHAGFAAGMRQLDAGACALRVDEIGDALECGDVLVFPDAEIAGRDAAFGSDGRSLQHDQASAALGAAPRWTRCQSLAKPSSEEYWHMGETPMRFGKVTERSWKGLKRG